MHSVSYTDRTLSSHSERSEVRAQGCGAGTIDAIGPLRRLGNLLYLLGSYTEHCITMVLKLSTTTLIMGAPGCPTVLVNLCISGSRE